MQMHGKDHLDTYLLRVLYTLLTEQSVTRTAVKLGQSQPAISNTLKRLREITGDAILVRGKNGMVPTERGHELLALAQQSLEAMERIARPSQAFDPATTTRTFHLGAPDYLDAFFLPNIIERLRKQRAAGQADRASAQRGRRLPGRAGAGRHGPGDRQLALAARAPAHFAAVRR